jgi:23S rRNA (cytosine1962-C5)-methyltransferase
VSRAALPSLPVVTIAKGREKPLRQHHPWVFSGAVAKADRAEPGSIVDVRDHAGAFLGRGYFNHHSQIRARILTWREDEAIDAAFWQRRLAAAAERRAPLLADGRTDSVRLVMGEADLLPGLIIDKYGDWLVVQALTAGIAQHLDLITRGLVATLAPKGIVERSDDAVRELEGLMPSTRTLAGAEPPSAGVTARELGLAFQVDLVAGHKTGFYLDQRTNRSRVAALAKGARVLDCFSYTGGFAVHAAAAGAASVLSVDASETALERAKVNLAANGYTDPGRYRQRAGDAFKILRELVQEGETFDIVVMDPPKFAATGAQVERAARGYKDVNLQAFKLVRPGGYLATFSCSGHMSADLFQKIVFSAALDAGKEAQIVDFLAQGADHPVLLTFPESLYLKGLLCRVLA